MPRIVADDAPDQQDAKVAPWPLADRNPVVLGSGLTLQSISNVFRSAQTGYRQQYVDVLDELLEREPHGFAVLSQRILACAGGRLEVTAAKTDPGSPDEQTARDIAGYVRCCLDRLPSFKESLAGLLWALYYGIAAAEISWSIDAKGWYPSRLHFVHSRRLSYPDPSTWELHIWDQGFVRWGSLSAPTSQGYGVVLADFPGKFIVHAPSLRGDYPTREGLGRELAYWFALKGIAARGAGQYVERFGKPWTLGYFRTGAPGAEYGRAANDDDIAKGGQAAAGLGAGTLSAALLPDSIKLSVEQPTGGLGHAEFISLCDAQISKAVVGQTLTTEVGSTGGNRALGQVHKDGQKEIARYDAASLSETLKRDLVTWIVRLNFPEATHLIPTVTIIVDEKPNPMDQVRVAAEAVKIGMPVDADELAERLGLPLVDPNNPYARRLVPLKLVDLSVIDKTVAAPVVPPPPGAPAANDEDPTDDDAADEADNVDEDEPQDEAAQ